MEDPASLSCQWGPTTLVGCSRSRWAPPAFVAQKRGLGDLVCITRWRPRDMGRACKRFVGDIWCLFHYGFSNLYRHHPGLPPQNFIVIFLFLHQQPFRSSKGCSLIGCLIHFKQCPRIIGVRSHNLFPRIWVLQGWNWWQHWWWNRVAPVVQTRLSLASLQPHGRWGPKPAGIFGKPLGSMNLDELLKSMWSVEE